MSCSKAGSESNDGPGNASIRLSLKLRVLRDRHLLNVGNEVIRFRSKSSVVKLGNESIAAKAPSGSLLSLRSNSIKVGKHSQNRSGNSVKSQFTSLTDRSGGSGVFGKRSHINPPPNL